MEQESKKVNGVVILPEEEDLDHLSPSRMKTFMDCRAKYYFRYIEGRKIPPASALTLGSSYDDALTTNYKQKIESRTDMPVSDVVDAFVTSFNIRKPDTEWTDDEKPEQVKDVGVKIVEFYQKTKAPEVQPIHTQVRYNIKFPGVDWELVVIPDLKEEDGTIVDNKTSKRSPSKNASTGEYMLDQDHYFQMLCYSIADKSENGPDAGNRIRVDYAIKSKIAKLVSVTMPAPGASDYEYFENMTSMVYNDIKALEKGVIAPIPNRKSNLCSRKYCGFWSICETKFKGKVKE